MKEKIIERILKLAKENVKIEEAWKFAQENEPGRELESFITEVVSWYHLCINNIKPKDEDYSAECDKYETECAFCQSCWISYLRKDI